MSRAVRRPATGSAESDSAPRTRRYRERKRLCADGDHSLCGPRTRCPELGRPAADAGAVTGQGDVTGDVTSPPSDPVTSLPPPAGLGVRGGGLWERMSGLGFGPGHLVLLEEACRTTDTLERLHTMLATDRADWFELLRNDAETDEDGVEVRVVVNGLLVELRQQQSNLRQLVAELRLSGRSAVTLPSTGAPAGGEPGAPDGSAPSSPSAPTPAPDEPAVGGEGLGLGDLIDAARRFQAEG